MGSPFGQLKIVQWNQNREVLHYLITEMEKQQIVGA